MKIAMIGQRGLPATYGGIDTWVENVAFRLVEQGHEVTVFCRANYYKHRNKSFKGVRLKYLPCIPTKHLDTLSHSLISSIYAISGRYQIIHYHGLGSSLFAILPRLFFKKSILTVQGLDWRVEKWGIFAKFCLKICEWASAKFPERTVVVSKTLAEYYKRKYKKSVCYIPNGADVAENSTHAENAKGGYLLFLGRLMPNKGIHYLIEAFRKLKTHKKLVIAGGSSNTDGDIRHIRDLARTDGRIVFTGPLYGLQKEEALSNAYLFVFPSEVEGLSLSLLEAMGHRRCCLVSDIPENLEAIGEAGFSFKVKDTMSLREKLEFLLSNPDLVEKTGQRARARIQQCYNWKNISDEIEGLYSGMFRAITGRVRMFGIEVDSVTMPEAIEIMAGFLKTARFHHMMVLNAAQIYSISKDKQYKQIYKNADFIIADGIYIVWASRLLRRPIKEQVAGADLLSHVLTLAAREGYKVFILKGSEGGVTLDVEKLLLRKFPDIRIAGTCYTQYDFDIDSDMQENDRILGEIRRASADILIVSLGSPKGQKWIWRNSNSLGNISICVEAGAAIDFVTNRIRRAPVWMQRAGLEWLFRFCHEPRRLWKRNFLNNTFFLWSLMKEFFKNE